MSEHIVTALLPLVWLAYLAFAFWCAARTWRVTRTLRAYWLRRLLTCGVLSVFLAPSVIPAGHGAGLGPAWLAAAFWAGDWPRFVLLPIGACWAALFAVWSLGAAWKRPAAPPPVATPVAGSEIAVTTAALMVLPILAVVARHARVTAELQQHEARSEQLLQERRFELDREAVGAWRRESGDRWVLRLSGEVQLAGRVTLARVPESGPVAIVGSPGSVPPGTQVVVDMDGRTAAAVASADAGGGFEIGLNAPKDAYLSLRAVRFIMPGRAALRGQPVVATPQQPRE